MGRGVWFKGVVLPWFLVLSDSRGFSVTNKGSQEFLACWMGWVSQDLGRNLLQPCGREVEASRVPKHVKAIWGNFGMSRDVAVNMPN